MEGLSHLRQGRESLMKLDDLAKNVAAESGMSMVKARTLLDRVFGAIGDAVARGEDVTLPGFGKFASKATTARTGRNPRTGEPMQIAASTKAVFTPAKALKDKLSA
ncbi:HU family DNA-binding protein [Sphingomonas sp. CCH9-F2]